MHLAGRRPVLERLKQRPETIHSLYLSQGTDLPEIVQAARQAQISFETLSPAAFQRKTGEIHAQGVLAEVDPFRYAEVEDLIRGSGTKPLLLLLDRITDPQNLGSILRTTACLGGIALVLPKHDSAGVTDTVLRVACGGENHVPVALVTNLSNACQLLKRHDYWIAGAQAEGGTPLHQVDWPSPLALILGSEGGGIRHGLQKQLDLRVTLPMPGAPLSFNVGVAAALIAYEIRRPRR